MTPVRGRAAAVVAAALAVDLVLVAAAVRHTSADPPVTRTADGVLAGGGTSPPAGQPPDGPIARPSPSAAPSLAGPEAVLLDAASAELLVRGEPGTCADGGAALGLSEDGGATWQEVTAPVRFVARVNVTDRRTVWLVGSEQEDCALDFYRSRDGGRTWQRSVGTTGAWHALPRAGEVHAPNDTVTQPCGAGALALAPVDVPEAYALCGDGTVLATTDGSATWRAVTAVPGGTALAFAAGGTGYAAVVVEGCGGAAVARTTDGGQTWAPAGCAEGVRAAEATLSAAPGGVVVAADAISTGVSTDGGQSWVVRARP